jgi:hypothetical protein
MLRTQVIGFNQKYLPKMVSMSFVKTLALCLSLIISSTAHADELAIRLERNDKLPAAQITVQTFEVDRDQAPEEVAQLITESNSKTIVSAEDEAVLTSAARAGSGTGRVSLLPFGKAIKRTRDAVGGLNHALRTVKADVAEAIQIDKIGVVIVTYGLGSDVLNWIHVDTMSTIAKTAGILYMIVTTTVLSLNKKSRLRFLDPLETMYRRMFDVAKVEGAPLRPIDSLFSFVSTASLWTIVNAGLVPILAIDQLGHHALDVGKLTMPLVIGIVTTVGSFTWTDFYAHISEAAQPRAKAAARMLLNLRAFTLGTIATTAMLVNYSDFGIAPWIGIAAFGAAGWPLYLNVKTIADRIEASPLVRNIARSYRRTMSVFRGGQARCEAVF